MELMNFLPVKMVQNMVKMIKFLDHSSSYASNHLKLQTFDNYFIEISSLWLSKLRHKRDAKLGEHNDGYNNNNNVRYAKQHHPENNDHSCMDYGR